MKHFLSILFLILSITLAGQNVIITGNAQSQPDRLIRVIVYDDMFSNMESTIASERTDANGDFAFKIDISKDKFAYLALGLDKGEFYLSPGSSYRFEILNDTTKNKTSVFDRLPLGFIVKADDGGLHVDIEEFNIDYNDFVYNNVNRIYRSRDKSVVKNFISTMNNKYADHSVKYVSDYVYYTMANLEWIAKVHNNSEILDEYIINKPVLYNNIQYCDFFKEFFKSYFGSEKTFRYEDLIPALNSRSSLDELYNLVKRDTLLVKDDRVMELVTMLLMSRNYFDRYVDKEEVDWKFNEIASNSPFEENKNIARNYLKKLKHLLTDTPAPEIELFDSNGNLGSIEQFKDRFVLMAFVERDCKVCVSHLAHINELQKKLDFEVLLITTNGSNGNYEKYIDNTDVDWSVLYTGENILILEDYNVRVFPTYVFLNPDGTIAYVHLPMPEENMEIYLTRFMQRYNSKTE